MRAARGITIPAAKICEHPHDVGQGDKGTGGQPFRAYAAHKMDSHSLILDNLYIIHNI